MASVTDVLFRILEDIVTKIVVMGAPLIAIEITEAARVHLNGKGKHVMVNISFL